VLLSSPFFLEGLTLDINHHGEERRFLRYQPDPVSSYKRHESQGSTRNRRRIRGMASLQGEWAEKQAENVRTGYICSHVHL